MNKFAMVSLYVLASASAFASGPVMFDHRSSSFNLFDLDPSFGSGDARGLSGSVMVDRTDRTVYLDVAVHPVCDPQQMCPQFYRDLILVQSMPVVDVRTGNCRETIIVARQDLRAQDGALEQITIVDNSSSVCTPLSIPVQVTYRTQALDHATGKVVNTISHFGGSRFEQLDAL